MARRRIPPPINFLLKVTSVAAAQWYVATRILDLSLSKWFLALFSFISFTGFYIYNVYIYPNFFSPFRHLPSAPRARLMQVVTERPRGISLYNYMISMPDADLIRLRTGFGGSMLFPVSPDALRDVMGPGSVYNFSKPAGATDFLARIIGWGLILSEGDAHKRQRKLLTPAFNIRNIRALYPLMWEKTGILLEQLAKTNKAEGSIEISGWSSRLTLDIIGPAALSRDFQSLTSGEEHDVARAFAEILEPKMDIAVYFALNFFIPQFIMKRLPMRGNKVVTENTAILRRACRGILDEKKETMANASLEKRATVEEHDILQQIINTGEFKDDEIIDQMLTFLAAGHETTASALTWLVHLLTLPENKHYQKILRDEIRSNIPTPADGKLTAQDAPTSSLLESLPYLNGLCEEVLRLFPTVPVTLRISVNETVIAGTRVPPNNGIVLGVYAINRNPRYWGPDAAELRPERWIDKLPDGSLKANKHGGVSSNFCEITFLHGARACIGRDFAKAELRCAVAGLFGRYDVSRLPGDNGHVEIAGTVTTKPEGGLKVSVAAVDGW